jgi:hypothetical protein
MPVCRPVGATNVIGVPFFILFMRVKNVVGCTTIALTPLKVSFHPFIKGVDHSLAIMEIGKGTVDFAITLFSCVSSSLGNLLPTIPTRPLPTTIWKLFVLTTTKQIAHDLSPR